MFCPFTSSLKRTNKRQLQCKTPKTLQYLSRRWVGWSPKLSDKQRTSPATHDRRFLARLRPRSTLAYIISGDPRRPRTPTISIHRSWYAWMGEDCSFLVAFAAAPRASRLPSVLVMWLLPLAVAMALIALGTDGCSDDDAFGTTSGRGQDGSIPNTTTGGMGGISRTTATCIMGVQGTAMVARGYGGSGTTGILPSRHGRHGVVPSLNRLSVQLGESRGVHGELDTSDSGGGTGVVPGSTMYCSTDRIDGKVEGEEQVRYSGGSGDWCERDEASRTQDG